MAPTLLMASLVFLVAEEVTIYLRPLFLVTITTLAVLAEVVAAG